MRIARVLLVIVAVVCLGVAVSYPIRYRQAQEKNDTNMEDLARMRQQARQEKDGQTREDAVFPAFPERRAGDSGGEAAASGAESAPLEGPEAAIPGTGEDSPAPSSDEASEELPEGGDAPSIAAAVWEDIPAEPGEGRANASDVPSEASGEGGTNAMDAPSEASDEGRADAADAPSEASGDGGTRPAETSQGALGGRGSGTGNQENRSRETGGEGANAASGPAGQREDVATPEGERVMSSELASPPEPEPTSTPEPMPTPKPTPTPEPTREPNYWDLGKYYAPTETPSPTPKPTKAGPTVEPTPTPDRSIRNGPLPYALKEKKVLDTAAILPELKDIYTLNSDLVGWINIPDTVIDYPVVQAENGDFYLTHDFYGEENVNGQIILDVLCDPYTPSYNLVVSGHHMKNGSMFGGLPQYRTRSYWEKHPFLEFDTLMERKIYVIFACFYSADYDEDETGFRYNAIIDYKMDAEWWLEEIEENQLYDTGIEREFGDEFITLTTCDRARHRNGRFVVVGRKIREGETFE